MPHTVPPRAPVRQRMRARFGSRTSQQMTCWSRPPEMRRVPSPDHWTAITALRWPRSRARGVHPVPYLSTSQSMIVRSRLAVATVWPSALSAMDVIRLEWPLAVPVCSSSQPRNWDMRSTSSGHGRRGAAPFLRGVRSRASTLFFIEIRSRLRPAAPGSRPATNCEEPLRRFNFGERPLGRPGEVDRKGTNGDPRYACASWTIRQKDAGTVRLARGHPKMAGRSPGRGVAIGRPCSASSASA